MSWVCIKCKTQISEDYNSCPTCSLPKDLCDINIVSQLGVDELKDSWKYYDDEKKYSAHSNAISKDIADIIKIHDDNNELYKALRHGATNSLLVSIRNVVKYIMDGLLKENRLDILRYTAERDSKETIRILKRIAPEVLETLYAKHSGEHLPIRCICGLKPVKIAEGFICNNQDCSVGKLKVLTEDALHWNNFIKQISGDK